MAQFPHIRVRGSAYERGHQLGEQAAARIARSVAIYKDVFSHYAGWKWDRVVEHANLYRPAIGDYRPRYLEEIQGIADGAGLDSGDVLALNVRTEIMFAAIARRAAGECTAFVALPQATADGHTLIGQNWDWVPPASDTVIVLEAEQDEGPDFVTVVEAGLLAKAGFNSAGIGLVTNALVTDQDCGKPAVPYHIVLRAILDAETMTDALDAITRFERSSSANYLIAHRDGEAINVEAAPGDFTRTYLEFPSRGTFAHTNHYVSTAFDLRDVMRWDGPDSPFRWHRMTQFLERDVGHLTPESIQGFLGDHFNYPSGICQHPDPRLDPADCFATVASVVMDLATRTMWIADGNPCHTPFRAVEYHAFLDKLPAFLDGSPKGG